MVEVADTYLSVLGCTVILLRLSRHVDTTPSALRFPSLTPPRPDRYGWIPVELYGAFVHGFCRRGWVLLELNGSILSTFIHDGVPPRLEFVQNGIVAFPSRRL
jgi:hypothetical protein